MSFFRDTVTARPYRYAPIDPETHSFRAVRLLKSHAPGLLERYMRTPTVAIEIVNIGIGGSAEYDTLSYAWDVVDNPRPKCQVLVRTTTGNQTIEVHEPLARALAEISASNIATRPIFVDQICIDQSNDVEKAQQVHHMSSIYSQCQQVIVWLGPSTRVSDAYFDFVREVSQEGTLGRLMGPHVASFKTVFDAVMDPTVEVNAVEAQDRDDVLSLLDTYGPQFPLAGLTDVLKRSWFNRLWIIQEVCLAPNVQFVCGGQSLCFDCFRSGTLFYTIYNTFWVGNSTQAVSKSELRRRDDIFTLLKGFIRLFQERKAIFQDRTPRQLYDLVLKYNVNDSHPKIGATLAEDRLFGLAGLALERQPLSPERIHYRNPVLVYTDFACEFVAHDIDALLFSQFPKTLDNLPSWVPDWSMSLHIPWGCSDSLQPIYSAGTGARTQQVIEKAGPQSITVRAILFDTIVEVGNCIIIQDTELNTLPQIDFRSLRHFFREAEHFVSTASQIPGSPMSADLTEADKAALSIRLADFGQSEKSFAERLTLPAARQMLLRLYNDSVRWGDRLIRTDDIKRSYRLGNIFSTVGIVPSYWMPPSEMDSLLLLARKPLPTCYTLLSEALQLACDVVGMVAASTYVQTVSMYLSARRDFTKVSLKVSDMNPALERVGLDSELSRSKEMGTFTDSIFRNMGQRLYCTKSGYVGQCTPRSVPGDIVVVMAGGSVPHILRPVEEGASRMFQYIGEAYCEGIMEGELVVKADIELETIRLI